MPIPKFIAYFRVSTKRQGRSWGLRVSETLALQWGDFDWGNLHVMVERAIVQGRVEYAD